MKHNALIQKSLRRRRTPSLAICLLALLGAVTTGQRIGTASQAAPPTVFYIATSGNDSWSGRLPATNATNTDGPFATLRGARDAVRQLRAKQALQQPVNIMVRGGKYYLDEPLVLTAEDSGTREAPITYRAYQGEKPILSGGKPIKDWKPYKGEILRAELPGSRGGKWRSRQLFSNGRRQTRARYPNLDADNPLYGGWSFIEGPAEKGSNRSFVYRPQAFKHRWAKPTEAEVVVFPYGGTFNDIVPIQTLDEGRRTITLTRATRDFARSPWFIHMEFHPGDRFRVENLLEELDQPGEWCLDSEEGALYFWPPNGSIESHEVVVPRLDGLIDLRGASWLTLAGFTLTETTGGDDMHRDGVEGAGAMFANQGWKYCGEAIHLKEAEHCVIENNHFDAVGGNAVYLEGYNLRNVIRRNEIGHAGANGICLLGAHRRNIMPYYVAEKDRTVSPVHQLAKRQPLPIFNEVVDNYIHHCGTFNGYSAGVFLGVSDGTLVAHNRIEDLPHHAINLGVNGYGRNIVEYNAIRNVCLETSDNGAINSWMEDETSDARAGHVIRFNLIMDVPGCRTDREGRVAKGKDSNGIYLDNYTSNCFVYGNIIVRPSFAGIMVHAGKNNILENNIIVDPGRHLVYTYVYDPIPGMLTGNRFLRNILYSSKRTEPFFFFGRGWNDETVTLSNENVFFRAGSAQLDLPQSVRLSGGRKLSFEEWQQMGYDVDSIVGDPLFVAPQSDDYRLKADSPAIRRGFVPIDVSKIGTRHSSK